VAAVCSTRSTQITKLDLSARPLVLGFDMEVGGAQTQSEMDHEVNRLINGIGIRQYGSLLAFSPGLR